MATHELDLGGISLHDRAAEERPDLIVEPAGLVTLPSFAAHVVNEELVGTHHDLDLGR